ncbi:helix-turn-helix domain, rpiR family protein [Streptomyces laurentii]|uniref:Helix-turn-helix domain, rpiR family protein n=1 Tax=Streptomyces laurentii TaxID=39478 RepID=A0A160P888_STRLU|nr:helix-turn-helix domain, rpiR family protein [Streptomyces laurentii]
MRRWRVLVAGGVPAPSGGAVGMPAGTPRVSGLITGVPPEREQDIDAWGGRRRSAAVYANGPHAPVCEIPSNEVRGGPSDRTAGDAGARHDDVRPRGG